MTIPHAQSAQMAEALRALGNRADLMIFPGVKHGFGYGVNSEAQQAPPLTRVERFLDEVLG